ncbi:hypothetical protein TSUD_201500 [Trifolium subterraneum]|uniref:Dethiobiotin synthase n=1 Tax=Trifolium subterraneum TaxID=3900 RepID=A0A2Z6LTX5_TRISU|nr:hypothetical protein TSUD_201500 [Trifolium subterraneum]
MRFLGTSAPHFSVTVTVLTMYRFPTVLLSRHLHRRKLSTTTSQPLQLPLSHPIYTIWGSNTGVGKTLVSAGIAASSLLSSHSPVKFHYLKPLQTGFLPTPIPASSTTNSVSSTTTITTLAFLFPLQAASSIYLLPQLKAKMRSNISLAKKVLFHRS